MGLLQQSVPVVPLKHFEPSRAILDLIDNMRSKIYGFFCKIGFVDLPGLHEEDYVTLCVIENFLDFKMGEVWQEIVAELEMEGVQLVASDNEATDTILRASEERALGTHEYQEFIIIIIYIYLAVAATQNYIIDQYKRHQLQVEQTYYNEVWNEKKLFFFVFFSCFQVFFFI